MNRIVKCFTSIWHVKLHIIHIVLLALLATLLLFTPLRAQDADAGAMPNGEPDTPTVIPSGWTMLSEDGYTKWRLPVDSACLYSDHRYTLDLPEDPARMSDIRLTMTNYDVDYFDPQDCEGGPEFDNADLNGKTLGILAGANDSWSINSWLLKQSDLVKGGNQISIDTDATGTGCWCVGVGYIELQAKVGFQIIETTPATGEQNRDFHADKLDLTVTFSADLNAATVNNETFSLHYLGQTGQIQKVEGSFTLVSPNKFRFVPNADLLDGVRYYATVFGGANGVKNTSDVQLEATRTWNFWTVPNLDATDSFDNGSGPQCLPSPSPCNGVEIAVFQVARNATMIPNKDAVARLYLRWKRHSGVLAADQVKELTVKLDMDITPGGGTYAATQTVKRPDLYTDAQIRAAANTINIYHKPPSGFTYNVKVTPQPQSNVTPVVFNATKTLNNAGKSPIVLFDHYFLKDGAWSSGVPGDIQTGALNLLVSGAQITLDQFPAIAVNPVNKGNITFNYTYTGSNVNHGTCGTVKQVMCPVGLVNQTVSEPDCIYQKMNAMRGSRRVIAITVPQSVCPNVGGVAFNSVLMLVPTNNPVVVAHEVGHAYGISTANNPNGGHRNSPTGIEGFQVRTKVNRSRIDNPDMALSLMHTGPIANPNGQWIHNDDYATLFGTVTAAQVAQMASIDAEPYLLVSGMIDVDTATAQLDPLFLQAEPTEPGATGSCTAELLDGSSAILASVSFAPGVEVYGWRIDGVGPEQEFSADSINAGGPQPFALTLPWHEGAQALRISCGGAPLLTQNRTAAAPTAAFTDLAEGATLSDDVTINWSGSDTDGDALAYQLQFSEDAGATWTAVTAVLTETTHTLQSTVLSSGGNRKLRLMVTDGFNTNFVERSVTVANPLAVVGMDPPDFGENVALGATVRAVFNTPIDPQSLSSATFRVEQDFVPISGTLSLGLDPRLVFFKPTQPLEPSAYYSVRVDETLQDVSGSTLPYSPAWSFQAISDTVPPVIQRISPVDGESEVPLNAFVAVEFDEELDFNTTLDSISVVNHLNQPVAGTTNYYSSDRTLVFIPEVKLQPNADYKVTVSAKVKDENGNGLEGAQMWSFRTGTAESPEARVVGNYGERTDDVDGDGLIDTLTVYVDVQSLNGLYDLNARLLDKSGELIQWTKAEFGDGFLIGLLNQGIHRLALTFDARVIRAHQVDGPYFVDSLNFYNTFAPFGGDSRFDVYQTLPYAVETFAGVLSFKPLPDRLLEWNSTRADAWNLRDYTISLAAPLEAVTYRIIGNSDPRVGVSIDANHYIDINPDPAIEAESTITVEALDHVGNRAEGTFQIRVQKPKATSLIVPSGLTLSRNEAREITVEIQDQFGQLFSGEAVELNFYKELDSATLTPEMVTTSTGRATVTYTAGEETGTDTLSVVAPGGLLAEIEIVIAPDTTFLPKLEVAP